MKLLVVGREGQLARALLEASNGAGATAVALGRPDIDLSDRQSIEAAIARAKPDIVVNAAAYTAVDKAESEPALAYAVNAQGAEYVAQACAASEIPVIHISTDFVFDGKKHGRYREDDVTAPVNAYGRSKLEGERRVAAACERHLILRTSWLHSCWGTNFVKTMLRLAAERPAIAVVDDQQGAPTYAPNLAGAVLAIAARAVADPADMPWGVFHAADGGETTWFGFAREIFLAAAEQGLPVAEVAPITTADYPTPASRPANSRLDCTTLWRSFGLQMPDWRIGVGQCVARIAHPSHDPGS